jgi:aspartate kinase
MAAIGKSPWAKRECECRRLGLVKGFISMAQMGAQLEPQSRAGSRPKTRIVMKFGGTSVANIERINAVAARVKREVDAGHEVAVVVSAMSGHTNQLVAWCSELSPMHDAREYDAVVAAGEQITAGLMAIALQALGVNARSWLGWQIPITTNDAHGKARIMDIDRTAFEQRFAQGQVAVVAGFQGIGPDNRITTLGRGGSDTSAVALAAALKADRCDIFTDVDGVYTTDPRIVAKARKLDKVTYEEMLEMASLGAKVLQIRSVEMAMKHGVRVQVLSSFEDKPGTLVVNEDEIMEQELVSGIAYSRDEAKITLVRVPDRPGVAASIFGPLSDANINVDMIVQNVSEDGKNTDMTFTVSKGDFERAKQVLNGKQNSLNFHSLISDSNVVKVSVIGVGMRSHAGIAQRMFKALAEKGINIQVISTSEIKISVLVAEEYTELAVRALHTAYGLDAE